MLSREDFGRLARLLNNLHLCTGIKFALMDEAGREVYTSSYRAPFCRAIMKAPGGMDRCCDCDRCAVEEVLRTHQPRKYMCHAGLYEVAMPVTEGGRVLAIILFGQILDDSPREEQWKRVSAQCAWAGANEELHQAFLHLRRISAEQVDACMEIVRTCVSEVRLRGLNTADNRDDASRLRMYIDAHYAEPLDTDTLAAALHVGKTKLYAVCEKRFHMTPIQMVQRARIEAAQELLHSSRESIKAISQTVGFPDQNYFAKVFRRQVGMSPSEYRCNG
ncbi:MAG: PocR ligand-binding domain-containing protein [Clostridia bacterium]|nr:PocR ligand-binding domain-containing protein [Clostridia bacterium]